MERQKKQEQIGKVKMSLGIRQLTDYGEKALCLGKENKNAQGKTHEDVETSSSSTDHLDAIEVPPILSDNNNLNLRQNKLKVKKWLSGKNQLTENEDKVMPALLDVENQNAQRKNQDHIEVSSVPADPQEWERRMKRKEEERIKRQAVRIKRPPTAYENELLYFGNNYQIEFARESKNGYKDMRERYPDLNKEHFLTDYKDKMLVFGGENQNVQWKNQKDIEVSSVPTDPQEWERRMKRKEEERIKRQAVQIKRPPTAYENELLYFGNNYQIEFARESKNGYKDMRERYPDLNKVLASLNTSKDRTYDQNAMSMMPLDQSINEDVNTEYLRFCMVPSAASPDHRPLELAEPAPGPNQAEAPAHIHVRTVEEINALPRELFIRLLTTEGPTSRAVHTSADHGRPYLESCSYIC